MLVLVLVLVLATIDHEKLDCYRLDVLAARDHVTPVELRPGKELLLRIVSTLTKLIERLLASP